MIMKLQRPIIPPDGPWLIYNRRRTHEGNIPDDQIDAKVRKAIGDDLKGYFEGNIEPDGRFSIKARVAEQDW